MIYKGFFNEKRTSYQVKNTCNDHGIWCTFTVSNANFTGGIILGTILRTINCNDEHDFITDRMNVSKINYRSIKLI